MTYIRWTLERMFINLLERIAELLRLRPQIIEHPVRKWGGDVVARLKDHDA